MENMTNCKACGKEIAKGVKVCPHCGKDQRNFFMRHKVLSVIISIALIGGIGSMGNTSNTSNTPSEGATTTQSTSTSTNTKNEVRKPKYEILEHKAINDNGIKYITGKVKNNTGKQVSYAQVEINLYDANGQQCGSTLANVNNLEPEGVWNFKAIAIEDFTTYKIMDISGF